MLGKLPSDNGCSNNIRLWSENLSKHIDPGTRELGMACGAPLFLKSVSFTETVLTALIY